MNVYSVRLLPSLKLKFCQFLGIASTMAVDELSLRLESLERKIDRLDIQLRRSANRTLAVPVLKKKPVSLRKAAATPPKKKRAELKPLPAPAIEELGTDSLIPATTEVAELIGDFPEAAELAEASAPEALVLMQADENTRRSAAEYFGPDVEILEASTLGDLALAFDSRRILAFLFDRGALGQADFRGTLEILAQAHPETRMIGLSSYLTLALADSMPQREDFATFLTRPLSVESLAGAFEADKRQAIS